MKFFSDLNVLNWEFFSKVQSFLDWLDVSGRIENIESSKCERDHEQNKSDRRNDLAGVFSRLASTARITIPSCVKRIWNTPSKTCFVQRFLFNRKFLNWTDGGVDNRVKGQTSNWHAFEEEKKDREYTSTNLCLCHFFYCRPFLFVTFSSRNNFRHYIFLERSLYFGTIYII